MTQGASSQNNLVFGAIADDLTGGLELASMLIARGVPEEFIAIATEKIAAINAAWDRIEKERGL